MPESDSGDWIKLSRAFLESPIFQHDGLCRLWLYCLMRANWKPRKWLVPGSLKEVEMARGEFITGRESLHASLYPRIDKDGKIIQYEYVPVSRTLWRWLVGLSNMGCVSMRTVSNRCTVVTVCNYSRYQDRSETTVQPESSTCPASVQHVSTEEERKKERKKTNTAFVPPSQDEVAQYCRERNNKVDASAFVDFYSSKGWLVGSSKMKDWKAAVRTWEKRESSNSVTKPPRIPPVGDPVLMNWKPH